VTEVAAEWPRRLHVLPTGDVVLAAAVALLSELDVWAPLSFVGRQSHRPLLAIVFFAVSAALAWRRRAPLAVLAFVFTTLSLLYLAIGAPEALGTFLPPLAAIYSVGRYSEPRSLILAGPLALIGTALHEIEDPQFTLSGPAIFFWVLLAVAWPVGHAFRSRAQAVERLSRLAEELEQRREAEARAAAAAERARIARELHDVVGHGISVQVLQLVAALGLLESGELTAAGQRLRATERSARETLAEMRRLLGLLDEDRDAALAPQPGLRDVEQLVQETRAAGVEAELEVDGKQVELSAGLELAAYRIVQEALTNVIKHARPARAKVRISYLPDRLSVEVMDEGDDPPVSLDGGRGLAGMRERVALYDGELTVGPLGTGGYAVRARFPVSEG
jgi:signal transduction histidine kinase